MTGCSHSALNGTYAPCGVFAAKTLFKNESNNSHLYFSDEHLGGSDGRPLWRMNDGNPSHTGWDVSVFAEAGALPPLGKWIRGHRSDVSTTTYPTLAIQGKEAQGGSAALDAASTLRFSAGSGERAQDLRGDYSQRGTHNGRPKYVKVGDDSCVIGWGGEYWKASRNNTFPQGWCFSGGSGASPKLGQWEKVGCMHDDTPPTLSSGNEPPLSTAAAAKQQVEENLRAAIAGTDEMKLEQLLREAHPLGCSPKLMQDGVLRLSALEAKKAEAKAAAKAAEEKAAVDAAAAEAAAANAPKVIDARALPTAPRHTSCVPLGT